MSSKKHSGSGDGQSKDHRVPFLKPDGRFNTVHLLPVFLNLRESSQSLAKPSIFNNEMQMSVEDRLKKLIHTREKVFQSNKESFHFYPPVIVFQNFHPGNVYKFPLSVRNACQVIKPLHVMYEQSQYFSVEFATGLFTRIAPGMSAVLNVEFAPEDKKDCSYQVSLQSNNESFKVPVIAVGPRPLLDFPDDIHIHPGPIKIKSTKVVLVRNIGDVPAIFSLSTNSPFDVEPRKGVLRPSEMMNTKISVTPRYCGNVHGQLKICYETGEILYSQIYGVGEEVNVWFDPKSITIEETYIGVKQMASVTLHNESNHLLNFKWKKMPTTEDEFVEYDKLTEGYSFIKDLESQKYSKLSKGDLVDPETHSQVYNRMFDDEVRALKNEEFLFNHQHFQIRPLCGDIWPKSTVDIIVIFEATEPGEHTTTAYCDIPGHEERIPLTLTVFVKGPKFAFNIDVLDTDCIFVSKPHSYEIVAKNIGLIPGSIVFQNTSTQFGGKIICEPEMLGLMPEECKTFVITFSSNVQGEFLEHILFKVIESGEILQIDFKGFVVTPTLAFNEKSIDFGIVPFAFPTTHMVLLQNISTVPVNYKISVKGDGTENSISFKQYAAAKEKPRFPKNPREFLVIPSKGLVNPYSSTKVKITLTGNINREKKTTLVLELLDAISEPVQVPISHTVTFPSIICSPPEINIRFCFMSYPYTRTLILENKSNVMGFFHIIPQSPSQANTLMFSAPTSHGIVKPHAKMKIPITILTHTLGVQTCTVSMLTLGEDSPKDICILSGCGQGPVMTAEPHSLDYGQVVILETVKREFILTNDSPVPANFSMNFVKKNSPWIVVPQSGILPAEKNITVEVPLFLRDTGKYKDTLLIEVFGSRTLNILLSGEGIGTSLVIRPKFTPIYDLGFVLTKRTIERKFSIMNEGTKIHHVLWSPSSVIKQPPTRGMLTKTDNFPPIIRSVFHFHPNTLTLLGRQSAQFSIRGYSEREQVVSETVYCHGEVAGKKDILLSTTIKAHFIDPKVVFSVPEVVFKIDILPEDEFQILYEQVIVTNVTDLSYKSVLRTECPFSIMGKDGPVQTLPVALNKLASIAVTIVFDPSLVTDLYSRKFHNFLQVSYREHVHIDFLSLSGEVNFPNLSVIPDVVDFGCIPVGACACEKIEIINEGHLPINYRWFWLPSSLVDYALERCKKLQKTPRPDSALTEEFPLQIKDSMSDSSLERHLEEHIEERFLKKLVEQEREREFHYKRRKRIPKASDQEVKNILFPIIAEFFEESTEEHALQSLPETSIELLHENKYFDISPWYGQLRPHEVQTLSARFFGSEPTIECAVLVCQIDGGPSQVLLLKGEISDLHYKLSKTVIDIGHQIFCIPASEEITLTNDGTLPFDFSIHYPGVDETEKSSVFNLKVDPNAGFLTPMQTQVLKVEFTPGFIKKFNEPFTIQVGFLDPAVVTLKGFGVIPQLYAFLPRPKSYVAVIDIGYEAVDLLLVQYLLSEKDKNKRKKKKKDKTPDASLFGRSIPRKELNALMENGWTVITYEDQYPTIAEIDLVLERLLAQDHIDHYLSANMPNFPTRNQIIPGLIFPPYDIDFGIVVIGSTVTYSALLYNFGPIPVSGSFQYSPRRLVLCEQGFSFKMPLISRLTVDHTTSFQIVFTPSRKIYQETQRSVEFLIYLEIMYGAKIPIQVRALVTIPFLLASEQTVDFETIKVGECKTITITLSNDALVPTCWRGEVKGRKRDICYTFSFMESMATLLPQQTVDVPITFKPTTPGMKERVLVITVDGNDEKLEIQLTGIAVDPQVSISETLLQFEPTLPYPENYIKSFRVKNTGSSAVEVYLPHIDSRVMEEEKVLRALCDYYQTNDLSLPVRNLGEVLPKELTQFYQTMLSVLKSIEAAEKRKKKRSRKPFTSQSQTTMMSGSQVTIISDNPHEPVEDPLHEHMDEIRRRLQNSPNNDPVQAINNAVHKTDQRSEAPASEGLLLIFHGAPQTDSVYCARKAAKALNLKLLSVDEILIEAAAISPYPEAIKLREKINSIFSEINSSSVNLTKSDVDDIKDDDVNEEEDDEEDEIDLPMEDPVEEMKSKMKAIINIPKKPEGLPVPRSHSKKADQSSLKTSVGASQQSNRRSTKKSLGIEGGCPALPGITYEMLEELLRKRFFSPECAQGVVIDQLSSMFFDSAGATLVNILRAVGHIKYIHLFIFHNTFEQFSAQFKEDKATAEEAEKMEYDKKIEYFNTLSVEEVDDLSEEDQALYWSVMIGKRKEDWQLKKNEASKKGKKNAKKKNHPKKGNEVGKKHSKAHKALQDNQNNQEAGKKKDKGKRNIGSKAGKGKSTITSVASIVPDELKTIQANFNTYEYEYNDVIQVAMCWGKRKGFVTPSTKSPRKSLKKSGTSPRIHYSDSASQSMKSYHNIQDDEDQIITWIFNCDKGVDHKDEFLVNKLMANEEFNSCRPEPSLVSRQFPSILNWCIKKPDVRKKVPEYEEFIFCNYNADTDDDDSYDRRTLDLKSKSGKRKSNKRKSDTDVKFENYDSGKINPVSNGKIKTRWILYPGQEAEIKVQFDPHSVGDYLATYPVEVAGWRKHHNITVHGICDIPRIDMNPEVLFEHCVKNKEQNKLYRLTYFIDKMYFDFGAILVSKTKEKRLHHIATSFNLTNLSLLTAEVRVSFMEKNVDKVDAFAVEPYVVIVQPASTEKITVFASPRTLGSTAETLVISVKDNPTPERIKVYCTGVKAEFEVEPKSITFDHVLVFRKDFRTVKLRNRSLVPVIWHLVGLDDDAFLELFDISSTEGLIMPLDEQDIRFEFFATKVMPLMKRHLRVEVYDEEGRGDPIHIDHLNIAAETVDVVVDISFNDPMKNYVDFGRVRLKSENTQNFYLKNRGKHAVKFKIEIDIPDNAKNLNLEKILSVDPQADTLIPNDRSSSIQVICHPNKEIQLKALPVFKIILMDRQNIVATIPIQVSISALPSCYEISPLPDINFGTIPIGLKRSLPLMIKNTGVWDISFIISKDQKSLEDDLAATVASFNVESTKTTDKKLDKDEKSVLKQKTKSYRSSTLRCEYFTITPRTGVITPGETATLQVECDFDTEGSYSETICVEIPNKDDANLVPTMLELRAVASAPVIDFTAVESIFEGHFIVEKLEDVELQCDVLKHNVFVKDVNQFKFANTCLFVPHIAKLKLRNPGLVPCEVSANVYMSSSTMKIIKNSEPVFTLRNSKLWISPYNSEYLEIAFTPSQIGVFSGSLEITLETSSDRDYKYTVQLVGEGCVPIVTFIEPQLNGTDENSNLVFSPTLLGKKGNQKLIMQNTGSILCKVKMDISESNKDIFSIKPEAKTLELLNEDSNDPDSLSFTFSPNQKAIFVITFMPTALGMFTGILKISITGNPYEKPIIHFLGECYTEDITMELPSLFNTGLFDEDAQDDDKICQYAIDFGNCYVDTPKRFTFKINNHSLKNMYRFEFHEDRNITYAPTLGHLKPGASKEITVTLMPKEQKEVDKVMYTCDVEKIAYVDGKIPEGTTWDSRLKTVLWKDLGEEPDPHNTFEVLETEKGEGFKCKVVQNEAEPEYFKVPNSLFTIQLQISAKIGYASYLCDLDTYEFPETLMCHRKHHNFNITNNGTIPFTYNWKVVMDEHYPLRIPLEISLIDELDTPSTSEESEEQLQRQDRSTSLKKQSQNESTSLRKASNVLGGSKRDSELRSQVKDTVPGETIVEEEDDVDVTVSSASNRTRGTWRSTDPIPFNVEPTYGTLEPGSSQECILHFFPRDIYEFKVIIIAMIPHLHPHLDPLKIIVKGRSIMPLCYFETEESDYLISGRRDLSLPGPLGLSPGIPLSPETRVVEFKVVGVTGTYNRKILAVNPTESPYDFCWENCTLPGSDNVVMFFVSPLKGSIAGGNEIEMMCSFIAHDIGTFESFWNFTIPGYDSKYNFIFVSHVREPSVCFLMSRIDLCPTLIGVASTKYIPLRNNENTHVKFTFDRDSLHCHGQIASLEVNPMKGNVAPGEEVQIKIQFVPKQPGTFHFNLKCHVQGMKKSLTIEVTAECYAVQPVVTYEAEKNQIITLNPTEPNVIDLGEMVIKCPRNISFNVTNLGKTTFYYFWHYDEQFMKRNKVKLNFQTKGGHITAQSRVISPITCTFLNKIEVTDFLIALQINKGPSYKIVLRGQSTKPNYEFSSTECNFGMCFYKELQQYTYRKSVIVKNKDPYPILLECMFENTSYLIMENANGPINVDEDKEIFCSFTPEGLMKYEEVFDFLINGCTKQKFKITGEGVALQVHLQNPQNKLILFSPVLPGGVGFSCAPVINNSKCEVAVEFYCGKRELMSTISSIDDESTSSSINIQTYQRPTNTAIATQIIPNPYEISPTEVVYLKPQEVVNLCIKFKPVTRLKLITDKVYMKVLNHSEPLCILEGSCVGPEFSFDRYNVAFGAVLKGCSASQKLNLINSGEVGARFQWQPGTWKNLFEINPCKGYSSPDSETFFNIVFKPNDFDRNIRKEALCCIENSTPLTVQLTGACWQEPVPKEIIDFETPVRTVVKRFIPLHNKTSCIWDTSPQITGLYFNGPEKISVTPHTTMNYEITYAPLLMTKDNKPHKGTIKICSPEGHAQAYSLSGIAKPPLSSGKISREILCKEFYTELIPINNWLTTSQRFMVSNEIPKLETFDPVLELSGNEYIDVPGKAEREYKWIIYCYKECLLNIKVIFTNIETQEYLFYDLIIKVLKRGPLDTVKLVTPVRQPLAHKLELQNPLSDHVSYVVHCMNPDIYYKSPINVPPFTKAATTTISYIPFFPGEASVSFEFYSNELGSFPYQLELKALPPIPEKLIKCTVNIGSSTTMEAPINNLTKAKADFMCKINNHDFDTEKQISLAASSDGTIVINFEPTSIGNISALLKVSSPTVGEFQFPLLGIATPPTPQGPFSIKFGNSVSIPFKNVFFDKQQFTYTVDNPVFHLKIATEIIRPKKDTRITVSLPKAQSVVVDDTPLTGKLIVTPTAPNLSQIKWVYYLKAVE